VRPAQGELAWPGKAADLVLSRVKNQPDTVRLVVRPRTSERNWLTHTAVRVTIMEAANSKVSVW